MITKWGFGEKREDSFNPGFVDNFLLPETTEKKNKKTNTVLNSQITNGLKKLKNLNHIIVAYEPVWSIGTGMIPKSKDLNQNIIKILQMLNM